MELNAANATRLDILTTKMNEKRRFDELSAEEIQEIVDNAVAVKTKKAKKIGMRLFNGTYPLSFAQKLENFKYDRAWTFYSFVRAVMLTLMLQNSLLVLVASILSSTELYFELHRGQPGSLPAANSHEGHQCTFRDSAEDLFDV